MRLTLGFRVNYRVNQLFLFVKNDISVGEHSDKTIIFKSAGIELLFKINNTQRCRIELN